MPPSQCPICLEDRDHRQPNNGHVEGCPDHEYVNHCIGLGGLKYIDEVLCRLPGDDENRFMRRARNAVAEDQGIASMYQSMDNRRMMKEFYGEGHYFLEKISHESTLPMYLPSARLEGLMGVEWAWPASPLGSRKRQASSPREEEARSPSAGPSSSRRRIDEYPQEQVMTGKLGPLPIPSRRADGDAWWLKRHPVEEDEIGHPDSSWRRKVHPWAWSQAMCDFDIAERKRLKARNFAARSTNKNYGPKNYMTAELYADVDEAKALLASRRDDDRFQTMLEVYDWEKIWHQKGK